MQRFRKITNGLYRGSAPSPKDVLYLKDNLGINKIISLDHDAGEKINKTCKLLGIDQVKIYIPKFKPDLLKTLSSLFKNDLKELLLDGGPTFIHCLHGKDRTGLLAALFKCKYMGMNPEDAIKEAKSLGFGIGVDPKIVSLYEKLIRNCKPVEDINEADIVSNVREYKSDNRDSFLDEGTQGSFAPYLSKTRQYPADAVYNFINDQWPTRENIGDKSIKEHIKEENGVPQVGVYNNDAGVHGFGPSENVGGFIYD